MAVPLTRGPWHKGHTEELAPILKLPQPPGELREPYASLLLRLRPASKGVPDLPLHRLGRRWDGRNRARMNPLEAVNC